MKEEFDTQSTELKQTSNSLSAFKCKYEISKESLLKAESNQKDYDKTIMMLREKLRDLQETRDLIDKLDNDPKKFLADQ